MYHRINRIEDEKNLLEEMLKLQSQIREKRERKRISNSDNSEKYAKMLKPVTKSLEKLAAPPPPVLTEQQYDDEEMKNEELDNTENEIAEDHHPLELDDLLEEKEEEEEEKEEAAGELYQKALQSVPIRFRDDGLLGLDTINHRIGDYEYRVNGDILNIHGAGEDHTYAIDDSHLWKLLLVKNPQKINLAVKDKDKAYLPFVEKYRDIARDLHLGEIATSGTRKRTKYKMIMHKGSGFLFTVRPPVSPNTIILPSDNQGILRALYVALAELRAGNNSMQNVVVALAQQAARKGILPENLLSHDEETWVFA